MYFEVTVFAEHYHSGGSIPFEHLFACQKIWPSRGCVAESLQEAEEAEPPEQEPPSVELTDEEKKRPAW